MIIGLFQSSISAVRVLKTYRYDWNTYYKTSKNCQRYNYINPLLGIVMTAILNIKLVLVGITIVMRY